MVSRLKDLLSHVRRARSPPTRVGGQGLLTDLIRQLHAESGGTTAAVGCTPELVLGRRSRWSLLRSAQSSGWYATLAEPHTRLIAHVDRGFVGVGSSCGAFTRPG